MSLETIAPLSGLINPAQPALTAASPMLHHFPGHDRDPLSPELIAPSSNGLAKLSLKGPTRAHAVDIP
jgi:hypothetical protein